MKPLSDRDEDIKVAYEEYKKFMSDEELKEAALRREKFLRDQASRENSAKEQGRIEGIAEGEEIGQKNAKIEIARKLLKSNMDLEQIAQFVGLKVEEIVQIKVGI